MPSQVTWTRSIGKQLLDVGGAFERRIVKADQHAVLRHRQVLLDEVGALLQRQPVGCKRVFGRIRRRAAVRDVHLARLRAAQLTATRNSTKQTAKSAEGLHEEEV